MKIPFSVWGGGQPEAFEIAISASLILLYEMKWVAIPE